MTQYIFQCANDKTLYRVTPVADGSNLPQELCDRWVPFQPTTSIDIDYDSPSLMSGLTAKEILDAIAEKGYWVGRITITTTERIVR
jgi:hypothetical protein